MLGELRNFHVEAKEKRRKRRLLEISIEPSKKRICRRDESKSIRGLSTSCTLDLPGTFPTTSNESPVSCNKSDGKFSPSWRSEENENLGELLEGFTTGQQQQLCENQHSDPQLKLTIHPAACSQFVGVESIIQEEERYGDLLENLIASVSPDELLFKLSIGNEIPEDFAPSDREERPVLETQGALNSPNNLTPAISATDSEIYADLQKMLNQPKSTKRSYSELDFTEQTNVALNMEDIGNEDIHEIEQLKLKDSYVKNHSENTINNLNREEYRWNTQKIALEKKLNCLEAVTEKLEIDEKLKLKESEKFSPDQIMIARRQLSVTLEDLLEEVDSLVCQKGSDGKKNRHRKHILNRRIQALAHANSCAIDEIGKIRRTLKPVSKPDCWKTNSETNVNELQKLKRKHKTSCSEDSEFLCVKRQRVGEGGPRILQDCTGNDVNALKEDSVPRTELGRTQKAMTEEDKTEEEKTFDDAAPADCEEKAKELEEPSICTSTKMKMVESMKSISSDNQVKRVAIAVAEKQEDKPIKQEEHATPLTTENIVTCNGLSFILQFESHVVPKHKLTWEPERNGKETMNKNPNLKHMEEMKMEWRKTHRGSVNWARKLDVETVLEQQVSASQISKPTENLQRRVFEKGPRPGKERRCKRWLIDQHILQDLLQQSVPTAFGHHSTESLGRDESEDGFDEDSSDKMSPRSLDVLGKELLQKLTDDSQDLLMNSLDTGSDFKDSDEDDYNEEQVPRTPNTDPPSEALDMPMLDLL